MRSEHRARRLRAVGVAAAPLLVITLLVAAMAVPAGAATFSNTTAITIPAGPAAASLYPSPIAVSGLSGTVTKVTVTLNGVSHTCADDIGVLLVGPAGQNVMLMHDVGSCAPVSISVTSLTFDDAAAGSLPDSAQIVAGTYKPTVGTVASGEGGTGPPPAPAPAPTGTALSVFNGTAPNGTWNLFVYDDSGGDSGSISGGWTLNITTNAPTITSFTPTSGLVGTSVTITGTNFTGATAVSFNNVNAPGFTVGAGGTSITVAVPSGATTGPIRVTTPGGTATSATNFTVEEPTVHDRSVTLSLKKHLVAKGQVNSDFEACESGVQVKIQRNKNGNWKTIATDTTSNDGSYKDQIGDKEGRYRALVKKFSPDAADTCSKDKSPVVKHSH
jgi:subtilisin-like proprotein convertase family protein